jgi:rhodanese-related sulfurtransferase
MKRGLVRLIRNCAFFLAGASLVFPASVHSAYVNIPPDTLIQWMTQGAAFDFLLIDVLDSGEMVGSKKDSVIAAENCRPYKLPWNPGDNSSVFIKTMNKLPKDTAIVIYCRSGNRSKQAAAALSTAGFSSVFSLNGGISGWTGPVKPVSYIKPAADLPQPSMFMKTSIRAAVHRYYAKPSNALLLNGKHHLFATMHREYPCMSIINPLGKCVVNKQNHLSGSSDNIIQALPTGLYVITTKSGNIGAAESFGIIR